MERTDIYQKYNVTRTDGKIEDDAVYFVLRIDRFSNEWDTLCRRALNFMCKELEKDGDPNKNIFGDNIRKWVKQILFTRGPNDPS